MAYIEVRTTFPGHRKTKAAARALRIDRHKLMGHLVTLWIWALDNVPSHGSLAGITDVDLEEAAEWPEDLAGDMVPNLIEAGFIDVEGDRRYLHDWDDYAGRMLKKREADRDRKRQERQAVRAEKRPTDVQRTTRPVRAKRAPKAETHRNGADVENSRPSDTPRMSSGQPAKSARQPAESRTSRASARGRTVPHRTDTVPNQGSDRGDALTARAVAKPARSAGTPYLSIPATDRRYPVARLLATRFRWSECSQAEWDDWAEEVDNEFPAGTGKGRDPKAGWRWLAKVLGAAPRDVSDVKRWFFDEQRRVKDERLASADQREETWDEVKHADPGPIARAMVGNGIGPSIAHQSGMTHEKAIAQLRRVRGQLNADAWQSLLERYGVTEDELDAPELREVANG